MKQDVSFDIFKIASKISDIYKSSEKPKKREITKTLFTNFFLSGRNLHIYWKKPFNLLMEKEVKRLWLPKISAFRTFYPEIVATMSHKMFFDFERQHLREM